MISRNQRRAFYFFGTPIMRINGVIYKVFRAPKDKFVKVHLGPGQKNICQDGLTLMPICLRQSAMFGSTLVINYLYMIFSVDAIYSHHVIEHLQDLSARFRYIFRCLKHGGIYRVGGPSGDSAIKKFMENDKDWFNNWPDNRRSIGGRFENFIFCRGEHLTILTYSYVKELMEDIGFKSIKQCVPTKETCNIDLFSDCLLMEQESDFSCPHTLIIEGQKP